MQRRLPIVLSWKNIHSLCNMYHSSICLQFLSSSSNKKTCNKCTQNHNWNSLLVVLMHEQHDQACSWFHLLTFLHCFPTAHTRIFLSTDFYGYSVCLTAVRWKWNNLYSNSENYDYRIIVSVSDMLIIWNTNFAILTGCSEFRWKSTKIKKNLKT